MQLSQKRIRCNRCAPYSTNTKEGAPLYIAFPGATPKNSQSNLRTMDSKRPHIMQGLRHRCGRTIRNDLSATRSTSWWQRSPLAWESTSRMCVSLSTTACPNPSRDINEKLDEVMRYGRLTTCRRKFLLRYFNENYDVKECGNCDVCKPSLKKIDMADMPGGVGVHSRQPNRTSRGGQLSKHLAKYLDCDVTLFEQLRNVRTQEAIALKVPPYVVFGDKTLREMATYFPQSVAALLQITGVGEQKCTQFGEKFLTVIRRYAQQNNIGEKIRQGGIV